MMARPPLPKPLLAALLLGCVVGLSGCGAKSDQTGQVLAKVNDAEISKLQFDFAARRLGVENPSAAVSEEITQKLIDRELAMQRALADKLDRQPDVLLQLEEARRDVLARVYAERIAARAERPLEEQAARYFSDHPHLFAQRRIYRMREAALPGDLNQLPEVRARLAGGQSAESVLAWLRAQQVRFNEQTVIRSAEQLPIEALSRLASATEGQPVFFETPRGVIVYQILAVQSAPVSWDAAKPIILEHLAKEAGKRAVDTEIQHLRQSATISVTRKGTPPAGSPS